jgi:hypothetical protein
MPILGPVTPPYDPVDTVLNFARVIANDCQITLEGNLLADTQPYVFPMLNLAWRKLQDRLGNNAIESFPNEVILGSIAVINTAVQQDPSSQVYISFENYFDGVNNSAGPVLPQDLEIPLKCWERASGQNALFIPMFSAGGGLPDRPKSSVFREWEWRDDRIYLTGAMQINDLRVRYKKFIVDPVPQYNLPSSQAAPVSLLRCAVAMAYLVVEVFAASRGATVNDIFSAEKELAIKQLINNTTRKKQFSNYRRRPYSGRSQRLY